MRSALGAVHVAEEVTLSLNEKVDHLMIWSSSMLPNSPAEVNARGKTSWPAGRPDKHLLHDADVRAHLEAQIAASLAAHGLDNLKRVTLMKFVAWFAT